MRVLLVNPEFPETYWGFDHALKLAGKRCAFPPLGLLTVSSLLPSTWDRRLVDLNVVDGLDASAIDWADMVFITGMLIQKDAMVRIARECKAKGKVVVAGGPYVSTSGEPMSNVDHTFIGEAETTLPLFIGDLASGQAKSRYKAPDLPALTLSPIPDFRLLDMRQYSTIGVQYSRGCPFKCEFCDIIEIYGNAPRTKATLQMLAELDALSAFGWRGSVFLVDDNFIGNKKNVRLLMPALVEWQQRHGFPFAFFTEASVNLADDAVLLADMQSAGFTKVFLGIETPVEASLKETHKTQNTKRSLLESVKTIQSYGLEVMAGFIVGFDNDPDDVFERQIEFIQESAIPLAMVGTLTALRDTQLWRRLEKEGRLLGDGSGNNTAAGALNFIPKMNAERLLEGHRSIVRTIYRSAAYYQRVLDWFERVPPALRREPKDSSTASRLATLARILVRLGLVDRERREFWRFTWRTLSKHPARFSQAMRLAVMGYHFRVLDLYR